MDESLRSKVSKLLHERWTKLGIDALLPPERDYALLWSLNAETTSGGLDIYLYNSSGDYANNTVDVLERYGKEEIARVLRRAMDALPGGWCAERSERVNRLETVPGRWEVFRALDDEYDCALIVSNERESGVFKALLDAYRREGLLVEPGASLDA